MTTLKGLKDRILQREARIGIIGLGYVGLPLAVEFAKKGLKTIGIDADTGRVRELNKGRSYILDVPTSNLQPLVKKKMLKAVTEYSILKQLDVIIICVPTPLRKTKEPDLSYVIKAVEKVAKYVKKGQLIILESTTYPGTTEEVILPMIGSDNLKVGKDIFLAFSPERVDPGNKKYNTRNIPKVVGGITPNCTRIAKILYEQIIDRVVSASSAKVAEMVKLLENTFRSVNIGMANELALMCDRLEIDVWEVINVASTKPFGFIPFYPGPGIGGQCIPSDPMYLLWKARLHGFEAKFIELASQINSSMPRYVVERIAQALNDEGKPLNGSKVFILGVSYKRDVSDTRESPALEIIRLLAERGASVDYHDPYVSEIAVDNNSMRSVKLDKNSLMDKDCVVIITDHTSIDYELVVQDANLILDTRNALKDFNSKKIKKL